jgi:hypothetical protein
MVAVRLVSIVAVFRKYCAALPGEAAEIAQAKTAPESAVLKIFLIVSVWDTTDAPDGVSSPPEQVGRQV